LELVERCAREREADLELFVVPVEDLAAREALEGPSSRSQRDRKARGERVHEEDELALSTDAETIVGESGLPASGTRPAQSL
jgi:hypothetical protein